MATKAFHQREDAHLHMHRAAPRFPAPRGSLAALAQHKPADGIGLPAAWSALWQACGGGLTSAPDGRRLSFIPEPAERATDLLRPIGFCPSNEAEWRGATMCLAAMLSLAGSDAVEAVFSFGGED
jgi:hypothetical protein